MSDAKNDCEALLNFVLPFACQQLDQNGEFYPYGAAMTAEEKIQPVATYDGQEHPASEQVIEFLNAAFRAGARQAKYRATALVYNVRTVVPSTGKKSDAIAIALDHRNAYSIVVLFPYQIENGKAVLDPAFAQAGKAAIFPQ